MSKKEQCEQCTKYKTSAYGMKCSELGRVPSFDNEDCSYFLEKKEEPVQMPRTVRLENQNTPSSIIRMPKDSLIWSVVAACLFFPTGITALIYFSKVDYFWFKGEKDYALELSEKSLKFRKITFGIVIVVLIVFILFKLLGIDLFD